MLIVHERFAGEAGRVLEETSVPEAHRFAVGRVPGFRPFAELVDGQPTTRPDDRTTGAPMFYTSGTTGRPKGVRRPLMGIDPDIFGRQQRLAVRAVRHPAARRRRPHHPGTAVPHGGERLDR